MYQVRTGEERGEDVEEGKVVQDAKLVEHFEEAFKILHNNLVDSFEGMKNDPASKAEITNLWKKYLRKFVDEATAMSEQYQNKELVKAITRMFIFGK